MGGSTPKGEARGGCAHILPERDQARTRRSSAVYSIPYEQDKDENGLVRAWLKKTPNPDSSGGSLETIASGSELAIGIRLHVTTVDVVVAAGLPRDIPRRPLDFASLPPCASFSERPASRTGPKVGRA